MTDNVEIPDNMWEGWPTLGPPANSKVWLITPLINGILDGFDLTPERKALLKDYPKLVELLEYFQEHRVEGSKKMSRFHFTPGPDATVETVAASLLASFQAIEDGNCEVLKFGDLSWREEPRTDVENMPEYLKGSKTAPVSRIPSKHVYDHLDDIERRRLEIEAFKG